MTTTDLLFSALADATRRRVFELLAAQPASVNEIAAQLPVSRAAVSQHLKLLLDAGLVDVESQGRHRIYRVRRESLESLAAYAASVGAGAPASRPAMAAADADDPVAAELAKWEAEAPHIDHGVLALLMYFAQIGQYVSTSNEEVAAQVGLSFSDVTLLGALRRLGPPYQSTPTQLSRTFWITLPGMTKRLTRLESLGLLKRKTDSADKRSVLLRLTPKGLATLRELIANHQPPEYHAMLQLPAGERRLLGQLLSKLLALIDRQHGQRRTPYVIR
jgi:DNA-binding MarR family transcriptional regulator